MLQQVYILEKKMPRIGLHFKNFPGFHYFVADSLVLAGYYKEALQLIELAKSDYKIYREFVWKGYYRQFQLMMAECYFNLKEKKKALELLKKINPESFYFISRKYFTVRYNLLKLKLDKRSDLLLKQKTNDLISSSSFEVFLEKRCN